MNKNMNIVTKNRSRETWPFTFFIKYPELYLPILEKDKPKAKKEVDQLHKLLREHALSPGSKILDFSCGIGRHAINLFKLGYEVVGYDPSILYIMKARKYAKNLFGQQKKIRFYQGAADQVSRILFANGEKNFDAILLMQAPLGFSTEQDDTKMLRGILPLGKEGCILIIESENRDYTLRNFRSCINYEFKKLEVIERWSFDYETSIAEGICKYYKKSGKDLFLILRLKTTLRLYSLHEVKRIINESGWVFKKCYGDIMSVDSPDYESESIVTLSKKISTAK